MGWVRWFVMASLLVVVAPPWTTLAQEATAVPDFGIAGSMSPIALYDALLATPFPQDLLPPGTAPLEPYEWRDSNDPDLAGAIGGVIFADGDPSASDLPTAIVYMVFPDSAGAQAPLATVAQVGEPAEMPTDGKMAPAVLADLEDFVGLFAAIDNVFVYGMAPAGDGAEQTARALAAAGVAHLLELAAASGGDGGVGQATPETGATRSGEDPFLALAAAPFPTAEIPFRVGSLVVLPMAVSPGEPSDGLVGGLLVRDADRVCAYPLVMYEFYADETAARDAFSAAQRAGAVAATDLPPDIGDAYPATTIDQANDTTRVLVQVGTTIVIGNAPAGDLDERRATATRLAQIAVDHLGDVVGQGDGD